MHLLVALLLLPVGAAAAPCPFAETAQVGPVAMLAGRVLVSFDPAGAEELSGINAVGMDPHAITPASPWKQAARWRTEDNSAALLILADPLFKASRELAPALEAAVRARIGEPPAGALSPVEVSLTSRGVRVAAVAGSTGPGSWMAVATYALPDGARIDAAAVLMGPLSDDATCREAAILRLGSVAPGPRRADHGGRVERADLRAGGTLSVRVPRGYAIEADVGWEFSALLVIRPRATGVEREMLAFTSSVAPDPVPPARDGAVVARGSVLGEPVEWRSAGALVEDTWVRGVYQGERAGAIHVEISAPTAGMRRHLRRIAERATLDVGTPPDGSVIQLQAPASPDP